MPSFPPRQNDGADARPADVPPPIARKRQLEKSSPHDGNDSVEPGNTKRVKRPLESAFLSLRSPANDTSLASMTALEIQRLHDGAMAEMRALKAQLESSERLLEGLVAQKRQDRQEIERCKRRAADAVVDYELLKEDRDQAERKAAFFRNSARFLDQTVDALQEISNEDSRDLQRLPQGLPRTYDRIDDKAVAGNKHEDGGAFDVSTFKRYIGSRFEEKMEQAYAKCDVLRAEGEGYANDYLFVEGTMALKEACTSLRDVLRYSECPLPAASTEGIVVSEGSGNSNLAAEDEQNRRTTPHPLPSPAKTASKAAKLLIDLQWRVVTACMLRPASISLSAQKNAQISLVYREVDEVLLECLRAVFLVRPAEGAQASLAYKLQYWHTFVNVAAKMLIKLDVEIAYRVLGKSKKWLEEQAERERAEAARDGVMWYD